MNHEINVICKRVQGNESFLNELKEEKVQDLDLDDSTHSTEDSSEDESIDAQKYHGAEDSEACEEDNESCIEVPVSQPIQLFQQPVLESEEAKDQEDPEDEELQEEKIEDFRRNKSSISDKKKIKILHPLQEEYAENTVCR